MNFYPQGVVFAVGLLLAGATTVLILTAPNEPGTFTRPVIGALFLLGACGAALMAAAVG